MASKLPHLIVTSFERNDFTGTSRGGGETGKPKRDRQRHSIFLKQQLEQAWAEAEHDEVVYHTERKGVYLEFRGEPGYELVSKSLENLSGKDPAKWTRLLNIRKEFVQTEDLACLEETVFATIFVPNSKKEALFTKIEQYSKSGEPRHTKLFESISNIRKALEVESFWQDTKNLIPADDPEWCEVWLRSDQKDVIQRFEILLEQQQIKSKTGTVHFPERAVKIIHASCKQLQTITRLSDDIAEYRRAKEIASFWLDQNNKEQAEWVETILERLEIDQDSAVSVCILDTGVNNGHPLIVPCLKSKDCQSVDPEWGTHDHHQHGTLMAGISAYGNLQEILTHDELIRLKHCLESVKILPPTGANEPELWGYVTSQAVSKAEVQAPDKQRIVCMAVTSDDTRDQGRPSSWSAELDQICSGAADDEQRLIIVSAGNCNENKTLKECSYYPETQLKESVHDPAQSWNALTVGAYTQLDQIRDPTLAGYKVIAPTDGLSPFSTTSSTWDDKWPIKPEIVMEGGNLAKDASGFVTECDDLSLLSTFYDPQQAHFYPFSMTSAATAQAVWFAAQLQAEYSDFWPETIRGLMVHSAEWTDALKAQFLKNENKTSYKQLIRVCGYGVPNLEKALFSAQNSLTLIAQSELQPFAKKEKEKGSGYRTKDMHLYELPWPKEVLQSLPDTTAVQMRITLSYFVEPGPGEIGWQDRYRYASHGLRFELNSPMESKDQLLRRINAAARDEEKGKPGTSSAADSWVLGAQARNKGSIHSDVWKGYASDLATSNLIAVYPTIGWWRERAYLGKLNKKTRYALIVSINTPEQETKIDIYTPVAEQIKIDVPVEINV
ncbi:MAG: S8 family peptidase [Candidatus Electrothrix sp. Rat3]|nr:S8 family peptidase [Candidatus Electrothrix rattekaaiensis]